MDIRTWSVFFKLLTHKTAGGNIDWVRTSSIPQAVAMHGRKHILSFYYNQGYQCVLISKICSVIMTLCNLIANIKPNDVVSLTNFKKN